VRLRAHETVESHVQGSLDRWIDYHTEGARVSVDAVRQNTTKLLKWGMALSRKHLLSEIPVTTAKRMKVLVSSTTL